MGVGPLRRVGNRQIYGRSDSLSLCRMRQLNETFTESEFEELSAVKGERTWHTAILDEFGVDGDE